MNAWGKKSKREDYGNRLKFLNCTKQKYDWDNDQLNDDDEGLAKKDPVHPGLPAKITGVNLESECMDHGPAIQEEVVDDTTRAAAVRINSNLPCITGVDLTNKEEAEHQSSVDTVVVEDVDRDEEEEDYDYDMPPMSGRHDQDSDSNSKSEDKDEDNEDPINLPHSSSGGS